MDETFPWGTWAIISTDFTHNSAAGTCVGWDGCVGWAYGYVLCTSKSRNVHVSSLASLHNEQLQWQRLHIQLTHLRSLELSTSDFRVANYGGTIIRMGQAAPICIAEAKWTTPPRHTLPLPGRRPRIARDPFFARFPFSPILAGLFSWSFSIISFRHAPRTCLWTNSSQFLIPPQFNSDSRPSPH